MFFKKRNEVKWNSPKSLPEDNERVVVIDLSGDVYTGNFEMDNYRFTMNEFLGMPFFDWSEIKFWTRIDEFKKVG